MTRRLFAAAAVLALTLFGASPGRADTAGLEVGPFRPGMPLADLRHAGWPEGARLLCGGDTDLPAKIDSPPEGGIALPPRLTGSGLVPCALFAPGADGTWKFATADFAGTPARVWLLAIAETTGAAPRLVQTKLWQPDAAFDTTRAFVTAHLGPAQSTTPDGSRWTDATTEVLIGHVGTGGTKGGILTILTDTRLEALARQRIEAVTPKPKPAH